MNLFVVGDIALANEANSQRAWTLPAGLRIGDDWRVLFNWELPIGDALNPSPRSSGPRLRAFKDSPRMLHNWAPGFATLATNHILDAGPDGLLETLWALRQEGFVTVGAGLCPEEIAGPLWWETPEGRLAVVNWVFPETHPDWMAVPGPNCWPGAEAAAQAIQAIRQEADWVACVVHWSDEHFAYPLPADRLAARVLIHAGADCVIGHHPHVVRGCELVDGRPIFYSIGNFCFDDIPDNRGGWAVRQAPRNREGLGIRIRLRHGESPRFEAHSFWCADGVATVDRAARAKRRMEHTSRILRMRDGAAYAQWYAAQRIRFDRWSARWHFGVRRLGVRGMIRHLLRASA